MSRLAQLQTDFQAYLLDDAAPQNFAKAIVNDAKVGARKRLQIYHDAYRLRIIEVLGNVYPNVQKLLSAAQFERLARGYITAYPSTYRNMRWMGDQMAAYLRNTLPQNPLAAELAQFEWALGLAFDAEDAPVLSVQNLAEIAPENWGALRFDWHPSVQIFPTHYNIIQTWQALENNKKLPKLKPQAAFCLVWRQNLMSHFRNVDDAEHAAMQAMMSGKTFGELCAQLGESMDEAAAVAQAAAYLATWLNDGLLSSLRT
jgi:hypothetical protein